MKYVTKNTVISICLALALGWWIYDKNRRDGVSKSHHNHKFTVIRERGKAQQLLSANLPSEDAALFYLAAEVPEGYWHGHCARFAAHLTGYFSWGDSSSDEDWEEKASFPPKGDIEALQNLVAGRYSNALGNIGSYEGGKLFRRLEGLHSEACKDAMKRLRLIVEYIPADLTSVQVALDELHEREEVLRWTQEPEGVCFNWAPGWRPPRLPAHMRDTKEQRKEKEAQFAKCTEKYDALLDKYGYRNIEPGSALDVFRYGDIKKVGGS